MCLLMVRLVSISMLRMMKMCVFEGGVEGVGEVGVVGVVEMMVLVCVGGFCMVWVFCGGGGKK